jgi:hypothetical protein
VRCISSAPSSRPRTATDPPHATISPTPTAWPRSWRGSQRLRDRVRPDQRAGPPRGGRR